MQCRQKRYDVFINLLWIFTTTLIFHVTCNFCTVIWALPMTGLRKITGIINDLQEAISTSRVTWPSLKLNPKKLSMDVENGILQKNKRLSSSGDLIEWKGHDFLFLFDLIACTCGRASTFRVLSYTSSRFHLILDILPLLFHWSVWRTCVSPGWWHTEPWPQRPPSGSTGSTRGSRTSRLTTSSPWTSTSSPSSPASTSRACPRTTRRQSLNTLQEEPPRWWW